MQSVYKIVEADTVADVAETLNLLQKTGRMQVDVVLPLLQHPWRILIKVTPLPSGPPYIIAWGTTAAEVHERVQEMWHEGYRPIGGIVAMGMSLYQAMAIP